MTHCCYLCVLGEEFVEEQRWLASQQCQPRRVQSVSGAKAHHRETATLRCLRESRRTSETVRTKHDAHGYAPVNSITN